MTIEHKNLEYKKEQYEKLKSFVHDFEVWNVIVDYNTSGYHDVVRKSIAHLLKLSEEIHNLSDREIMHNFIAVVPTAERTNRLRLRFSFSSMHTTTKGLFWTSFRQYEKEDMQKLLNDLRITRFEIERDETVSKIFIV
jgi:hypothetical protein